MGRRSTPTGSHRIPAGIHSHFEPTSTTTVDSTAQAGSGYPAYEGSETLNMTRSNPSGARLAVGEATGAIED